MIRNPEIGKPDFFIIGEVAMKKICDGISSSSKGDNEKEKTKKEVVKLLLELDRKAVKMRERLVDTYHKGIVNLGWCRIKDRTKEDPKKGGNRKLKRSDDYHFTEISQIDKLIRGTDPKRRIEESMKKTLRDLDGCLYTIFSEMTVKVYARDRSLNVDLVDIPVSFGGEGIEKEYPSRPTLEEKYNAEKEKSSGK